MLNDSVSPDAQNSASTIGNNSDRTAVETPTKERPRTDVTGQPTSASNRAPDLTEAQLADPLVTGFLQNAGVPPDIGHQMIAWADSLPADFDASNVEALFDRFRSDMRAAGIPAAQVQSAIKWFAETALELDDLESFPLDDSGKSPAIEREIAEIQRVMRTNSRAYFRDERMQARYRELLMLRDAEGS